MLAAGVSGPDGRAAIQHQIAIALCAEEHGNTCAQQFSPAGAQKEVTRWGQQQARFQAKERRRPALALYSPTSGAAITAATSSHAGCGEGWTSGQG